MRITAYALSKDVPFELEINEDGSFLGGLRFRYRGYSHQFDEIQAFAQSNTLDFSLPGQKGLLHSGDSYDSFGIDFISDRAALDAVFCLLESPSYTFDGAGFIALAKFAQQRLTTTQDDERLNSIIQKRFDSSLQNNKRLIEAYQKIRAIVVRHRTLDNADQLLPYESSIKNIEALAQLMRQNQTIYQAIRKLYNNAVTITNYTATDVEILESWVDKITAKLKQWLYLAEQEEVTVQEKPAIEVEERQKILTRKANVGLILDPIGTSELDNHLIEDRDEITKMTQMIVGLSQIYQKNITAKQDSDGWFGWLIKKFKELFVSAQEEATKEETTDVNSLMASGVLGREEQYLAFEFKHGTYLDGDYNLGSRAQRAENPIITVLDAKNMPNQLKLKVIRCLLEEHHCDVNEVDAYSGQTVLEYLLASPNSSLYLEDQGKDELYDIAKLLIDKGAYVNSRQVGALTPLHYAAESPLRTAPQIMQLMIERGAKVNHKSTQRMSVHYGGGFDNEIILMESTPLAVAVISKNPAKAKMVELLINHNAHKTDETPAQIKRLEPRALTLTELHQASLKLSSEYSYSFHSQPSKLDAEKLSSLLVLENAVSSVLS